MWKTHIDWDEPLEESLQSRWIKIVQEIRETTELVIPRQYFTTTQFAVQDIHVFTDASTKVCVAVAYCYTYLSCVAVGHVKNKSDTPEDDIITQARTNGCCACH